ncbi:DUF2441 domain-containing protein [Roseococcus pinisoli]|uniref:DUF2441 domain-containing protein n=1 Tax=Roseococcus pinisoli TaxID=2835040 RepID=A0ABS5QE78_9PROT|nr:DUF2441 domain-containing protein [Roseococcus pinisoli]MBS7811222.1 DUF2441 domain-containing protein [Roseococcus pinisoli]
MPIDAWHFADAYTLDRARLNKGFFQSVSAKLPGELNCWTISSKHFADAQYGANGMLFKVFNSHANRIEIFELIRKEVAPTAPSRNDCFFAFASRADAVVAQSSWQSFGGLRLEQVQIQDDANVFLGDADLYTNAGTAGLWVRDAAYRFWLGRRSANPKMEYLVGGTVYFPNWESFPAV